MAENHPINAAERWLPVPIPEFVDDYEVSDLGRVRRRRDCLTQDKYKAGRFVAQCYNRKGYLTAKLCGLHIRKTVAVHKLVVLAFVGPRPEVEREINHINGIKTDNRITNLEYVTSSENHQHAIRLGLINLARGERVACSRLTESSVREIRAMYASGSYTQWELARMFGVRQCSISDAVLGKTWKHVS